MNNEPVAWWDGKEPNVLGLAYHQNDYCHFPLYTHPAELTDEEIIHIWNTCETDDEVEELVMKDFILFARAILRKAQEK